jgi:C1A family cysteine protease
MTTTRRVLNCTPSRRTEDDWRVADGARAGVVDEAPVVPPRTDLRTGWWKIGDQKDTGSCVGWACVDSVVRWHLVEAARIRDEQRLSVRFAWMAAKETDPFVTRPTTFIEAEGTSLKAALDVARRYGVVTDEMLPFEPERLFGGGANAFYATAARLRVSSYYNLGRDPAAWRAWIATQGPVLTRLDVDATWDSVDESGRLERYRPETARGGHAVALVGYGPDHFIVRNSWGWDWAHGGFAYASEAYAAAAFTEAYGVTV